MPSLVGSEMCIRDRYMISAFALFFSILFLMLVVISYVVYYNRKNYGLFIHKFYSITRLVLSCIELFFLLISFIIVLFIPLPPKISPYRILVLFFILISFLIAGLNFYWSLLFMKVVSRRSRSSNAPKADVASKDVFHGSENDFADKSESDVIKRKKNDDLEKMNNDDFQKELSDFVNESKS